MPPRRPSTTAVEAASETTEPDIGVFINREAAGIGNALPTTWEELAALNDGQIIDFEGSPWEVLPKDELIGVPFMIADVRHYEGKFGNGVVAVMVLTEQPLKGHERNMYVINDGSTGLYEQVTGAIKRAGKKSGFRCPRGLRKSDYTYEETDFDGNVINKIPATTFYIA